MRTVDVMGCMTAELLTSVWMDENSDLVNG